MTETYHERMRRRAARLVLEKNLPPHQAAKILQCTVKGVRTWVAEYLDLQSTPISFPTAFVPVVIEESGVIPEKPSCEPIPLEILTTNGLTLRLQIPSLDTIATLLKTLEADRC